MNIRQNFSCASRMCALNHAYPVTSEGYFTGCEERDPWSGSIVYHRSTERFDNSYSNSPSTTQIYEKPRWFRYIQSWEEIETITKDTCTRLTGQHKITKEKSDQIKQYPWSIINEILICSWPKCKKLITLKERIIEITCLLFFFSLPLIMK